MVVGDDLLPPGAVVVAEVDEVQLGVGEVDALRWDVQREAVGPIDLGGDDGAALRAVHADPLDAWVLAPVGPEQPPGVVRRVESLKASIPRCCDS